MGQARRSDPPSTLLAPIEAWFELQGWTPLPFQRQCWQAYLAGESGLIQVPTGSGKTYAAVMGPIAELLAEPSPGLRSLRSIGEQRKALKQFWEAITTLWPIVILRTIAFLKIASLWSTTLP